MAVSLRFLLVLGFAILPLVTKAQSNQAASVDTEVSEEERTKAKKRLYPGGRDEEPLQVQQQLVNPTKTAVSAEDLHDEE